MQAPLILLLTLFTGCMGKSKTSQSRAVPPELIYFQYPTVNAAKFPISEKSMPIQFQLINRLSPCFNTL